MKLLIVIACLIAVSYAGTNEVIDGLVNSFKKAAITCKGEVGATDADVQTMKANEIPTTPTGKCFVACVYNKLNFMTEDGKFKKDVAYEFIEKLKDIDTELYGKFTKMADTCFDEVVETSDACETATNMLACIKTESDALGIKLVM
nr:odorant-binding protein 9 [Podabrus annulatus]